MAEGSNRDPGGCHISQIPEETLHNLLKLLLGLRSRSAGRCIVLHCSQVVRNLMLSANMREKENSLASEAPIIFVL